ncbi:Tetraspanin family [Popillia japonica]|uniref:Tetraspanin family n=1 Tax=Popillia japonica TaxID=7064 RepID=A0AAW1HSR3_POPJA
MEHKGLVKAAKYYLMIVNMVFVVLSVITVCCVIYGYASGSPASSMTSLLVAAGITVALCALGFYAARQESPKLLKIFGGIMIGVLILEFIMVVILATSTSILYAALNSEAQVDDSLTDEDRELVMNAFSSILIAIWVLISIELILEIVLVIAAFYFAEKIQGYNRAQEFHAMEKYDNSNV